VRYVTFVCVYERLGRPQFYKIINGNKIIIDADEFEAIRETIPSFYPDNPTWYIGLVVVPLIVGRWGD